MNFNTLEVPLNFEEKSTCQMKGTLVSTKTYRYFTYGNQDKAKKLLYVLHGYGQLAEYFIRKFHSISEDFFIVAPEGMHRYYLNGNSGRVGASWMTKEDRESDIHDNLNWLNQLDAEISKTHSFDKKIVLGFSQGSATAARWFYNGKVNADHLIIWASVFPPDLQIEKEIDQSYNGKNYFLIGERDEYFTQIQIESLDVFYKSKGFHTRIYKGEHDINTESLIEVLGEM